MEDTESATNTAAALSPVTPLNNLPLSDLPVQEGGTTLRPVEEQAGPGQNTPADGKTTRRKKQRDNDTPKNYYDVPMLQPPVWKWEIATYFFLGGLSAGAYCIARMASRFGGKRYTDITRAGTLIAAAAFVPCPPLLIRDLGDWKRFRYMLRVFRPKSPMSVGSWVLSGYGAFVTLAALNEARKAKYGIQPRGTRGTRGKAKKDVHQERGKEGVCRGGRQEEGRKAGWAVLEVVAPPSVEKPSLLGSAGLNTAIDAALDGGGVPFALLLAGYTGVLLSTSATPLWARNSWLGALFSSSAVATGASAIRLALEAQSANAEETPAHKPLEQIETASRLAEAVALAGYLHTAGKFAAPITTGKYAPHLRFAEASVAGGLIGSALLGAVPVGSPKTRRALRIAGAVAGVAGGFALRWAISQGGHISGNDAQAARDSSRK